MIFMSKYLGLKMVIVPARYLHDASGQRRYQAGKTASFSEGRFETEDQEVIDAIKADKRYGIDFWAIDTDGSVVKADQQKLEAEQRAETEALETTVNSCPICSFKAANKAGLTAHIRGKHSNEKLPEA